MKHRKPRTQTLAALLDHTRWDYSEAADRSFLLASVETMFASVAWEVAPQHLTPMAATAVSDEAPTGRGDYETQPLERLIRED